MKKLCAARPAAEFGWLLVTADLVFGPDWRKQDPADPHHPWFAVERAVEPE
jgi:hypothetical protein